MKLKSPYLVKPGSKVKLSSYKTDDTGDVADNEAAEPLLKKHQEHLSELQELLYASEAKAFLIVLQGMDTAGKDGTIRHIFSGINPQGCDVAAFKVPTSLEARHDFLWRCHLQVPPRGMIGIFNRSHYEDVLSPRVHGKLSKKEVARHLDDINAWEKTLTDNDVVVLKFFLHISHDEQTKRLQARIDDPSKHWKLSPADFQERQYWDDYMAAYEDIFRETSHKHAPWFIIPSDHKWYRNVAISEILVDALESLKLEYPAATFDPSGINLKTETPKQVARQTRQRENPEAQAPASKPTTR
jgi:PPK2 family polyphosphate:nucleotide phosphotransferase